MSVGGCSRQSARTTFDDDDPVMVDLMTKWRGRQNSIPFSVPSLTAFLRSQEDGTDLTPVDQVNNNYQQESRKFGDHVKIGSQFTFRVLILQIIGFVKEYREIFCQFNFLHKRDEVFSTEPIKNTGIGPPPGFFRIQHITVTVNC